MPPSRPPKQLLLAFLGEYVLDSDVGPIRASALISVLEGAGVAAPATRATLDRLVQSEFLSRERRGRETLFSITDHGSAVLSEASDRVRGPRPFDAPGDGWTLVTFSIPEDQRQLRHRLRATLSWDGFAPIRDGLWLAPGEVDLEASLLPLRDDLPAGSLTAFHARELPGFSIADSVRSAWDIAAIRAAHETFIGTWTNGGPEGRGDRSRLTTRVMLVADWLALLSADPRLPREFMGDEWPAATSFALYRRWRDDLEEPARAEFGEIAAPRRGAGAG